MNTSERAMMEEVLVLVTGWNVSVLKSMNDEELENVYVERVENRGVKSKK